ncbi:hypothetical protein MMPV_007923 [Pyropia vietnamensis]
MVHLPPAMHVHIELPDGVAAATATAAVVLLHGLFGTADDWSAVAPALMPLGLPLVAVDLPYHGASMGVTAASVPAAAAAVAHAVVDALPAVTSIVLVGYSLGGRIALAMAAAADATATADADANAADHAQAKADADADAPPTRRRLRVDGLLLISAHPGIPPAEVPARRRRDATTAAALSAMGDDHDDGAAFGDWLRRTWYAADLWGSFRGGASAFDALLARRVRACVPSRVGAAVAAFSPAAHANASPSGWSWLGGRRGGHTPVVYVYGEEDRRYADVARRLAALPATPAVAVVGVPGVGHAVVAQAPAAVATAAVRLAWRAARPSGGGTNGGVSVSRAYVRRFVVPLRVPMSVGGVRVTSREGVLLHVVASRDGRWASTGALAPVAGGGDDPGDPPLEVAGVAEVSPLPGLHAVTLPVAEAQVTDCLAHLLPRRLYPSDLVSPVDEGGPPGSDHCYGGGSRRGGSDGSTATATAASIPLFALLPPSAVAALSPTVTCAVECALLQVLAAGVLPLADALAALAGVYGPTPPSVGVNAVVPRPAVPPASASATAATATAADGGGGVLNDTLLSTGVGVVKLKVGAAATPTGDAAATAAVLRALPPGVRVRLDANRAWTPIEAGAFVTALVAAAGATTVLRRIEYVEEPLVAAAVAAAAGGHEAMAAALTSGGVSLPYALDESLIGEEGALGVATTAAVAPGRAGTTPWPAAVVLKPAVLGSLGAALRVAATWAPAAAVASTCFDSAVGVAWATLLAAVLDAVPRRPLETGEPRRAPAHGLGTLASLAADVVVPPLADVAWATSRTALDVEACARLLADVADTVLSSQGVAAATPGRGLTPIAPRNGVPTTVPVDRHPPPPGAAPRFALSAACAAVPAQLFPR